MKFKIHVQTKESAFSREFSSFKTLRQYERRNITEDMKVWRFIFNNDRWEPVTIIGNQVVSKTRLLEILNTFDTFDTTKSVENQQICLKT